MTHAITIQKSPGEVCPWLAQTGSGRAGWYAYDFTDNGGHTRAERILADFQKIEVGAVFPALPEVKKVFVVVRCDKDRDLVPSWRSATGTDFATWAFLLENPQPNVTRLIVRGRIGSDDRPHGLPLWFTTRMASFAHAFMERKQSLGIKRRAGATDRLGAARARALAHKSAKPEGEQDG